MDGYSLRFRHPNGDPLQRIDIDPLVTEISYQTGAPGGHLVMSVGMVPGVVKPVAGTLDPPQIIPPFADVTLYKGIRPLFRGWVIEFADDDPAMTTGFVAEGYGTGSYLAGNWNRSTTSTASNTGDVLTSILTTGAPKFQIGQGDDWQNPGVSHSLNDFTRMTIGEVIDQVTKEGSVEGFYVDFFVWEDLVARLIKRVAPDQPEYRIPFDRRVRRNRNYRTAYGAATVEYGTFSGASLTAESYNEQFEREFGVQRFKFVPSGNNGSSAATNYRDAQLANAAGPTVTYTIAREMGDGLERADGGVQPFELVRAGEWVQVGDDLPRMIVATTVDLSNRSLLVEVGDLSPYTPTNWFTKGQQWVDRLARFIAPLTGGRIR